MRQKVFQLILKETKFEVEINRPFGSFFEPLFFAAETRRENETDFALRKQIHSFCTVKYILAAVRIFIGNSSKSRTFENILKAKIYVLSAKHRSFNKKWWHDFFSWRPLQRVKHWVPSESVFAFESWQDKNAKNVIDKNIHVFKLMHLNHYEPDIFHRRFKRHFFIVGEDYSTGNGWILIFVSEFW